MVSKKRSLVAAAIITILFSLSVAYVSCTKPLEVSGYSCSGVVCSNAGFCDSGRCVCPVGYDGLHCETATVNKFFGTYTAKSTVVGSDSVNWIGRDTIYNVLLSNTATPTTFFINNFAGDPFYSSIVCTLDSTNSYAFNVDTTSRTNMVYDHYRILGGSGSLSGDSVVMTMFIRHLDVTANWQNDTLRLVLHAIH